MTIFPRILSFLLLPIPFFRRHWKIVLPAALLLCSGILLLCERRVASAAEGRCHTDLATIEARPVALLLGTAPDFDGRENAFYTTRIEAAAELFNAGKVRAILASGDNSRRDYDEPSDMKADLIAAGVPAEFITLDYAGFRTRDSVIRAKEVFGQLDLIVVSQRFHAERALFIAQQQGIEACAYIARDPSSRVSNFRVRAREVLARTLAVGDDLVGRRPKFLGAHESVQLCSK
jgi:SanA protein